MKALYEGTMSAVRVNGNLSELFETVVDVLQGCVLSPLLFNNTGSGNGTCIGR